MTNVDGPGQRFSRSVAVVIGIDEYTEGVPLLHSAVADATAIAGALERDHGFELRCLFDRDAGLSGLLRVLRTDLPALLGPDDRLVFYFAGHGVALESDAGPAGYLLPATARRADRDSFLAMHVLHAELARLPVRHALVILDCCFAGTFRWSSLRDVALEVPKLYHERYDRYVESAAWQVLASTAPDQLALDVLVSDRGEAGGSHSPFARALLDGLAGAADYTADNLITASELAIYVRERVEPAVEAGGRRQTPQLFVLDRHQHGEFLFQVPGRSLELPSAPVLTEDANPYQGLRSFLEADRARFFGRRAITQQLVDAIAAQPLTVVVGPSGCGKSSVVHAGAVPALRANGWTVLSTQRPAGSPLAALSALAAELHGSAVADADPVAAWRAAVEQRVRDHRDAPWLVIIDQLEELITQRPARDSAGAEHAALLDALAFALRAAPSLHVVVTVRSDAEPQFHDSALGAWWTAARIAIPGMSRSELREVIERPATRFVLHFEPGQLVDRLIDDVALAPAPLPLLSFALSELYRRCWSRWRGGERGRALLESDYVAMGSVASALTQRATALHDELIQDDPAYAGTIRNMFTRMVAFVNGDRARRRVPRSELVYATDDENRRVEAVLDRFHDARLVSLGSEIDETGRIVSYAEPTHDELIRGWTQVTGWLDELDRPTGTRALVNAVGAAASAWSAHQRAVPYLWTDPRVELSAAIRRDRSLVFNADEDAFIGRSLHRRRSQRWRRIGSIAAVVTVLAAGAALWQRDLARNAAERQGTLALSYQEAGRQLLVAGNSLQALPYIVAAHELREAGAPLRMMFHAAVRTLPLATLEHDGAVSIAVFSPDGLRIATASADHTARVWDAVSGAPVVCPLEHDDKVTSVVFSHDGRRIVTASDDNTARIWDAVTGAPIGRALQHDREVKSAELSRDGTRVVTASWDGTARLWDAATGAPLGRPMVHRAEVFSARFSTDGSRVVTASEDGTAQIWDATTGAPLTSALEHGKDVFSAAFSPDGARVVTASADHHARIWDAVTGQLIQSLAHDKAVETASFSPDGKWVVTAGADDRARIWDAATGELAHELRHGKTVLAAAFSPDGARVVTVSRDRTARIWDAASGRPWAEAFESGGMMTTAAFSPDGSRVVTASTDRSARVWSATRVERLLYPLAPPGRISAAFSPDGTRIVTTATDHTVRVWDAAGSGRLFLALTQQAVVAAAFSPDGTRIVSAGDAAAVRVWDAATGAARSPALQHPAAVEKVAFSSDGARVVTASADHTVRLWDAVTGKLLTPAPIVNRGRWALSRDGARLATEVDGHAVRVWDVRTGVSISPPLQHRDAIVDIAFARDGTRVLTASRDATACLWDATTGARIAGPLQHRDGLASAAFSPDGTRVVTASDDQTARIWDAITGGAVTAPLQHEGWVTAASFSPDGARVVTVSLDQTVRVWDAKTGKLTAPPFEHPGRVMEAVFSPDGARVATTCLDRQVRVWDAATGRLLAAPFEHPGDVTSVAFSPDGARILATSDRGAHLWDVALDQGALTAWQASVQRGPYALTGGVVAPRGIAITPLVPDAGPVERPGATPALSCPKRGSIQTASAAW